MAAITVSHQPVGFKLEVSRNGSFTDVPGQVDLAVAGDAAAINNLELLSGESLSSRGSVPPETVTAQLVWNPAASVIKTCIAAKYSGNPLSFKISTPAPFYVYKAVTASKYTSGARDAGSGLSTITFSGADATPNLGRGTVRGSVGAGHYFVVDASNGYVIDAIGTTGTTVEAAVPTGYTAVVAAADYLGIVMPQLTNEFTATVTNVGNFTAAATGEGGYGLARAGRSLVHRRGLRRQLQGRLRSCSPNASKPHSRQARRLDPNRWQTVSTRRLTSAMSSSSAVSLSRSKCLPRRQPQRTSHGCSLRWIRYRRCWTIRKDS